jgi:hypothetical protein
VSRHLKDVLEEIVNKQHKIAVFEDLIAYLEDYLPSDVCLTPDEKLSVEGPCLEPDVSYAVIENVIEFLSKMMEEESKTLDKLNNMEMKPNEPAKRKPRTTKPKSKPAPRKPRATKPK